MMNTVEDSLQRLQTDHIDLYYMHRWDENTPIEETQRALDDLVRAGKVRYVGCSDFAAWQLARANLMAEFRNWSPFIVIQSHYHMFNRDVEREVLPYCRAHGVGFIPYLPLAYSNCCRGLRSAFRPSSSAKAVALSYPAMSVGL